jgi:hypothetical protein
MAEIEINVLVNHGLSKRIPIIKQMKKEAIAWNIMRCEMVLSVKEKARKKAYLKPGALIPYVVRTYGKGSWFDSRHLHVGAASGSP